MTVSVKPLLISDLEPSKRLKLAYPRLSPHQKRGWLAGWLMLLSLVIYICEVFVKMLKKKGWDLSIGVLDLFDLIGIAPYVAVNFCVFDLVKKSLPEKFRNKPEASIVTAFMAATIATLTCYPLDTIRRQMQMRGTPYKTVLDAFPDIVARDGVAGLHRVFLPNALKTLPNSSIKLTIFNGMKRLISTSEIEFQRIMEENRKQSGNGSAF